MTMPPLLRILDRGAMIFLAMLGSRHDPGAASQPRVPADVGLPCADLSRGAVRQICLLRDPRALHRSDLGLCRHSFARSRRVLRARRLRHGHVPDAADRHARRLCRPDPAGLHGVPELEGASGLLVFLRPLLVRGHHGRAGAGRARLRVRLVRVPQPRHRRLSLDHHPGADLRAAARLLPQQFRLRRQQRPDRLQGHPRLQRAGPGHARGAVRHLLHRAGDRVLDLPRAGDFEIRQDAGRDPRRRGAHALPRLSRRILQAVRVHAVGLHGGRRRRALCAAGRHHQSERILAGQLHRGGDLGRGRRPRHAHRRGDRRAFW